MSRGTHQKSGSKFSKPHFSSTAKASKKSGGNPLAVFDRSREKYRAIDH